MLSDTLKHGGLAMTLSFSSLRLGQPIRVFMGAGWLKGTVKIKYKDSVVVQLDRRTTRCYDERNIRASS